MGLARVQDAVENLGAEECGLRLADLHGAGTAPCPYMGVARFAVCILHSAFVRRTIAAFAGSPQRTCAPPIPTRMLVFHDPLRQTDLPSGCVATIGNFDGMHVGHQEIVRQVVARARETGRQSALVTFHPHPMAVLAPERAPRQITSLAQKEEILAGLGLDAMLVIPFTHEFSSWTADRFIEEFLVGVLKVSEVRIGEDFCFGRGREGNLGRLREHGLRQGFGVEGIGEVRIRGIRVSSSVVRSSIQKGAMRATRIALNRTHFIDGQVATGRRLGRKIGVPTVNVDPLNDLFPGSGVYVTSARFDTFGRSFESVTNIGIRPTLYENYGITIESHILDFDSNVYGETVRVYFHELLRREHQFQSAVELKTQIRIDIDRARRYFLNHPVSGPGSLAPSDLQDG